MKFKESLLSARQILILSQDQTKMHDCTRVGGFVTLVQLPVFNTVYKSKYS